MPWGLWMRLLVLSGRGWWIEGSVSSLFKLKVNDFQRESLTDGLNFLGE
jgi:hypothetical protein